MAHKPNYRKTPPSVLLGLKDPVCRQPLAGSGRFRVEHNGHRFSFCSRRCAALFEHAPPDYLD
jgi:YHS domain-containing protein